MHRAKRKEVENLLEDKINSKRPAQGNRLNLNFSIPYTDERTEFVSTYLNSDTFSYTPPTNAELETMANYILWGKQRDTETNVVQDKLVEIPTRSKTWDRSQKTESLDALLAQPTFSEQQLNSLNGTKYRYPKETLSRAQVRKETDSDKNPIFNDLWNRIDELELELNYYDLIHGKRQTEPRSELIQKFDAGAQQMIKERAAVLTQFKYLKKRHLLVELRREQFTLRDSIKPTILPHTTSSAIDVYENGPVELDSDVIVSPIGLKYDSDLSRKLFNTSRYPIPSDFSQNELKVLLKSYWMRKAAVAKNDRLVFNFNNPTHVGEVFSLYDSLRASEDDILSTTPEFIDTLNYYVKIADLTDVQRSILDLKLKRVSNVDIAGGINAEYGKTYTVNYISTIFRQKIIPSICAAAQTQAEIIENLPYPENFKKCKTCGRVLLSTPQNFVRKSRSPDGLSTQCKRCDREARIKSKEKIKPLYYTQEIKSENGSREELGD